MCNHYCCGNAALSSLCTAEPHVAFDNIILKALPLNVTVHFLVLLLQYNILCTAYTSSSILTTFWLTIAWQSYITVNNINIFRSSCTVSNISAQFEPNMEFLTNFSKSFQYQISQKSVKWELIWYMETENKNGWPHGQTQQSQQTRSVSMQMCLIKMYISLKPFLLTHNTKKYF